MSVLVRSKHRTGRGGRDENPSSAACEAGVANVLLREYERLR